VAGGASAFHADGAEFDDFVGDREELGHGAEGLAAEILVESGGDDFNTFVGEMSKEGDDGGVKELDFFNADDFGIGGDGLAELFDVADRFAGVFYAHMGDDVLFVVADVDGGFEDLDQFFGKEGAASAADEFFRFSGVHAAADNDELTAFFHSMGSPGLSFSRSASNISSNSALMSSSVARPISLMNSRISPVDSG
jgi:hypothetical protein